MKMNRKSVLILFCAIVFSLGLLSVGYGFWTDRLDLEGDADVRLSVNVVNDVPVEEITSKGAIQTLIEDLIPAGDSSDSGTAPGGPETETPNPPAEQPPANGTDQEKSGGTGDEETAVPPEGGQNHSNGDPDAGNSDGDQGNQAEPSGNEPGGSGEPSGNEPGGSGEPDGQDNATEQGQGQEQEQQPDQEQEQPQDPGPEPEI